LSHTDTSGTDDAPNHPLAIRMGVVAGVSHNVVIGTIMGSFSVMLQSVEQRLGVKVDAAVLGMPLVLVGGSMLSPFVGVLIAKVSLRLLLLLGALLTLGGFLTLALTHSYVVYLLAYGLMMGPAMSLAGSIGPATLVTRWFHRNRGLALGIVHLPLVIAFMPALLNWYVSGHGAVAGYFAMAALVGVVMVPLTLLAIDHPPGGEPRAPVADAKLTADGSLSIGQLLGRLRFWGMSIANVSSTTSSVLLGSLLMPMGQSWGFSRAEAALLASVMSAVGMAGSILFGWVADRIGGARALALVCFDCAVLWTILLTHPSFGVAALVIGLIGMHGAAAIPSLGRALSDTFGQASYSRGFGLNSLIALPLMTLALFGSAKVSTLTGSYDLAIKLMAGMFVIGLIGAIYAAGGLRSRVAPASAAG